MVTIVVSGGSLRRGAGSRAVLGSPAGALVHRLPGLARDLAGAVLRGVASLVAPVACLQPRVATHLRISATEVPAGDTSKTGQVGG